MLAEWVVSTLSLPKSNAMPNALHVACKDLVSYRWLAESDLTLNAFTVPTNG